MKTYIDCLPCFVSQALRAARIASDDEEIIRKVVNETGMMLKDIPVESTPPEIGRLIYKKVRELTGNPDPYRAIKKESTSEALALYPSLKKIVEESDDKLLTAVRIAIAGNVIDFGVNRKFDLKKDIDTVLKRDFAVFDYRLFMDMYESAEEILYIGDNAGECVFDRVLIEEMNRPVTYAVRETSVINDALHEDAADAGLDKITNLVSSGTDAPGTVLSTCSREFREIFENSKFIISKGQGNFEALSGEKRPIFFLLMAKCPVIAADIGINEGDILLKSCMPCT